MEMNSSREIRRKEKPLEFKEELRWFAKGFQQPKMGLTGLHDSQARVLAYYSLALTSMSLSERPLL